MAQPHSAMQLDLEDSIAAREHAEWMASEGFGWEDLVVFAGIDADEARALVLSKHEKEVN
ncbi:MAG: hypothetical protein Q7T86_03245 [Hyphomicrobiaceae bacterium]|nr:hypothetical protein [Hyphomicrobiaceae bacterium]